MKKMIYLLLNLIVIVIFNEVAFYKHFYICYNGYVPRSFRRCVTIKRIISLINWLYNHVDLIKSIIQLIQTTIDFIDFFR